MAIPRRVSKAGEGTFVPATKCLCGGSVQNIGGRTRRPMAQDAHHFVCRHVAVSMISNCEFAFSRRSSRNVRLRIAVKSPDNGIQVFLRFVDAGADHASPQPCPGTWPFTSSTMRALIALVDAHSWACSSPVPGSGRMLRPHRPESRGGGANSAREASVPTCRETRPHR